MASDGAHTVFGPSANLTCVATYRRTMPVTLERMFENALDWEHLPWLHASSFSAITCTEAGAWGWRAHVTAAAAQGGGAFDLELLLDRPSATWVSRILKGGIEGSEIWTTASPVDDAHIEVVVDFYMPPNVDSSVVEAMGQMYPIIYAGLYDEDESMMVERQRQLQREAVKPGPDVVQVGNLNEVRAQLPLLVECFGETVRVVEVDGRLVAHGVVCPHLRGPLGHAPVEDGAIQCPWHGYRFDVSTGKNLDGHRCTLPAVAVVQIDGSTGLVSLRRAG